MKTIKLTAKQHEAMALMSDRSKSVILLYGGSRSGKTFDDTYYVYCKALMYPGSNHLILRQVFNDAKKSVWADTMIPMLETYFPDSYTINKTDHIITFANGSKVSLDGLENEGRVMKIMGREYNTIVFNEMIECSYPAFQKLRSRLSRKCRNESGKLCHNNFIGDCNPAAPTHWLHTVFIDHLSPNKKPLKLPAQYGYLLMQPEDNAINLAPQYIEKFLDTLTGLEYARLRQGQWAANTEGLVYTLLPENLVQKPGKIAYYDLAVDWGYSHAFGLVVIGYGYEKEKYVVDEFKKQHMKPGEVKSIVLKYADKYDCRLGYAETQEPGMIADVNDNTQDFFLIKANKDRAAGMTKLRKVLEPTRNGEPWLYIVEPKCPKLVSEFFSHSYRPDKTEGLYTEEVIKLFDDLLDPVRYEVLTAPDQSMDDWMNDYDKKKAG